MKKFKLLVLALLLGVATTFAANTVDEDANKELHKAITELLKSSEMQMTTDVQEVEITFTLSSECEIVVLGVNTSDNKVKDFIRENINYKKICFKGGVKDKVYKMPLKFTK